MAGKVRSKGKYDVVKGKEELKGRNYFNLDREEGKDDKKNKR
jgi:hypothetical protein